MAAKKVTLKLFIDKRSQQRVLYVEADKEFVDFLLIIFTLSIKAVMRILKDGGGMVGSWQSLYQSFENLSVNYIQDKNKRFLLEPKVERRAILPLLLPNVGSTSRCFYRCLNGMNNINCISYVVDDASTICPLCKHKMDRVVTFIDSPSIINAYSTEEGYVKGTIFFCFVFFFLTYPREVGEGFEFVTTAS
jgi:hypothetical protein